MLDLLLSVLIIVLIYLCFKTIKIQGARILKLEEFVSEYLGGSGEQIHKRHSEDVSSVHAAYQGRYRASKE